MNAPDESVLESLRTLYAQRSAELRAAFDRSVPFGDLIVDRRERARALGFGEGASIYDSALVIGAVTVGERTWIGPQTVLDGSGGLTIGSTCSVSAGVQIYSHDSVAWALSGGRTEYARAAVTIEDRCYIGPMSVITKGVIVGVGSVVAANSVVTTSVAPGSIVGGSPARVLGRVEVSEQGDVTLLYDGRR